MVAADAAPQPSCAVCGSPDTDVSSAQPDDFEYGVAHSPALRIYGCRGCGSEFVHPRPSAAEIASFYPRDYYAYNPGMGSLSRRLFALRCRSRAKTLQALLGDTGDTGDTRIRLYDVGAGDCRHFGFMARHGDFAFAGVEMDEAAAEGAQRQGYEVVHGFFEELDLAPLAGRFDAVTLNHVVEHVDDPADALARACTLLRPGGCVTGTAPNLDSYDRRVFGRYWGGYHFPRHLQHFVPDSLERLFERAGFGEIRIRSDLNQLAALSCQNLLVGGLGARPALSYGRSRWFGPFLALTAPFSLFEHALGHGGCMFFSARKPEGS